MSETDKGLLIGTDFAAACREAGELLEKEEPLRQQAQKAAEERHHYEQRDDCYVVATGYGRGVKVELIDDLFGIGKVSAVGRDYEGALAELRMTIARAYFKNGFINDWTEARKYACRFNFRASVESFFK